MGIGIAGSSVKIPPMTTSDVVVEALERAGIRRVFGYPGGQNVRFIEAMRHGGVEFVLVTHEASAGFMADVTARLTGRPGACLSTLGPGATNLATGVGNAFLDRVPVLAFTGKMGRKWRGRTVQMQIDHRALFAPITKWSAEIEPASAWETMRRALAIAEAEQPGPVHLDFAEDAAEETSTAGDAVGFGEPPAGPPAPAEGALAAMEAALARARFPLLAVGLTANRARVTRLLREVVARHRLPVVSTMMAKGHVDESGPSFVGVLGRARRDLVAAFCRPADLVIGVGYDPVEFNYEDWVPRDVPVVHVDTVPADLASSHTLAADVVGDVARALDRLLACPPAAGGWDFAALVTHRGALRAALTGTRGAFAPHDVLVAMRDLLPADGILAADVGAHTHLIGQCWDAVAPGRLLVSNGWSSMGFCIPAAIAAQLARPDSAVVGCMGDGGFLMMAGEINTAVRLRLPVVFVVLRDRYLSLIKVKQSRRQFPWQGVELLGEGYRPSDTLFGAPVTVAESAGAFRAALVRALADRRGPSVIEAVVDPAEYDDLV
jgi:acetolactate synthase-1/2/3 large subunit